MSTSKPIIHAFGCVHSIMHQTNTMLTHHIRCVFSYIVHWLWLIFLIIFLFDLTISFKFLYENQFHDFDNSIIVVNQMTASMHVMLILIVAIIKNYKLYQLCHKLRLFLNACEFSVPCVQSIAWNPCYKIKIYFIFIFR